MVAHNRPQKPRVTEKHKTNFDTLVGALEDGHLCLLAVTRKADNKPVVLICAAYDHDDGDITPVPLAEMIDGDPFERYIPPTMG
jgi:hypothetical protein